MAVPVLDSNQLYKIVNVAYPTQAADLIFADPTGLVSGYHQNTDSNNQSWTPKNFGGPGVSNRFTVQNGSAPASYASVVAELNGAPVRGSPEPTTWTLVPVRPGAYQIATKDRKYVWVLSNDDDETPILIKPFSRHQGPEAQWTFEPTPRVG